MLSPTLCNITYDKVLSLALPIGAVFTGFANDLTLVLTAKLERAVMDTGNKATNIIVSCLQEISLQLLPEKTQVVVVLGRHKLTLILLRVGTMIVHPTQAMKYHGVWINKNATFQRHMLVKAEKTPVVFS